jgi:hypothetical protein
MIRLRVEYPIWMAFLLGKLLMDPLYPACTFTVKPAEKL